MAKISWEVILPLPEDQWQEPMIRASVHHYGYTEYAQCYMRKGYSREEFLKAIYEMNYVIRRHCEKTTQDQHAQLQEEAARKTERPVSFVLNPYRPVDPQGGRG